MLSLELFIDSSGLDFKIKEEVPKILAALSLISILFTLVDTYLWKYFLLIGCIFVCGFLDLVNPKHL